jgi:hypothetical protein
MEDYRMHKKKTKEKTEVEMLFELFDKDGNLPKKMKKQKEDDDE